MVPVSAIGRIRTVLIVLIACGRLFVTGGLTGDGEEHVVQVGGVDGQFVDLEGGVVDPGQQVAQRVHAAVVRYLQDQCFVDLGTAVGST